MQEEGALAQALTASFELQRLRNKYEDIAADLASANKSKPASAALSGAPSRVQHGSLTMEQVAALASKLPLVTSALQRCIRACIACRAAGATLLAACSGNEGQEHGRLQAAVDAASQQLLLAKRLLEEAQACELGRNVQDVGGIKRLSVFGEGNAWCAVQLYIMPSTKNASAHRDVPGMLTEQFADRLLPAPRLAPCAGPCSVTSCCRDMRWCSTHAAGLNDRRLLVTTPAGVTPLMIMAHHHSSYRWAQQVGQCYKPVLSVR